MIARVTCVLAHLNRLSDWLQKTTQRADESDDCHAALPSFLVADRFFCLRMVPPSVALRADL